MIGDAHWLSDGHHKEEIVREFLRRHLPPRLNISRGFVCPTEFTTRISPEIDILISDTESELPWFSEGGLDIVPPTSIRAHLHIKTTYGNSEIKDVLQSIYNVYQSCDSQATISKIWSGALFFVLPEENQTLDTILETFMNRARDFTRDEKPTTFMLPDCIAVLEGATVLIDKSESGTVPIRAFESKKYSPSILLNDIYRACRLESRARGEWNRLLESFEFPMKEDTIDIDLQ